MTDRTKNGIMSTKTTKTQESEAKSEQKRDKLAAPARESTPDPSLEKALACARAAIDKKAENIRILDLSATSGLTDYFVICSGMSDRQVQTIADNVESELKKKGSRPLASEGTAEGRWVVMDFGDVVVHVFLDAIRDYYDLESLWSSAPRVPVPADLFGPAATAVS